MKRSRNKNTKATGKQRSQKSLILVALSLAVLFIGYLIMQLLKDTTTQRNIPDVSAQPAQTAQEQAKKRGEVKFLNSKGMLKATVNVEIADNEQSRALGLMYRPTMGRTYGMLFVFDSAGVQSFWMKNTILSLDMIFVSAEGRIVTIHKNTTPYSDRTYVSAAPSLYVVEVNAGFSDEHQLKEGDTMEWRKF